MFRKKQMNRWICLLVTAAMIFAMMPAMAFAADSDISVKVKIENTTFTEDMGSGAPAWTGTLVDTEVTVPAGSTLLDAFKKALEDDKIDFKENSGYVSSIKGLSASDGGGWSGWMLSLNDWFSSGTMNDKAEDGDEIALLYSVTMTDLGGAFGDNDKTVKSLKIDNGQLSPAFDKDTKEYTLTIGSDVSQINLRPTASNKNFQVRMLSEDKEYKVTQAIPVSDGTVIEVVCGDPSWPTMNNGAYGSGAENVPAERYKITVEIKDLAEVTIRSQAAGEYLHGFSEKQQVAGNLAESYGYEDKVEGVSALDALVKAHEMVFGSDFTKETANDYLQVSSSGWVIMVFGKETSAFSFFINQGYPNVDGLGTTITAQQVYDGNVIDFIIYSDDIAYMDYYTWVEGPSIAQAGDEVTFTVKGILACYEAYNYLTPETLKAAAKPLPEASYNGLNDPKASLVWVDSTTGKVTPIENSLIDENGQVTVSIPEDMEPGRYYVAAESFIEDEYDDFANTYIIKNPALIYIDPADVSATLTAGNQISKLSLYAKDDEEKTDLLDGIEPQNGKYNVEITPGRYILEAFAESDASENSKIRAASPAASLGSVEILIDEDNTDIEIMTVNTECINEGWIYGKDYTIENLMIKGSTASDGEYRTAQLGENAATGAAAFILIKGDTYSFDVVPQGDKAEKYSRTRVEGTVNSAADCNADFTVAEKTVTPGFDEAAVKSAYEKTGAYLLDMAVKNGVTVASAGGDWIMLGLARSGQDIPEEVVNDYYDNVIKYVKENINDKEQLHRSRSTDNSRVILALTALGYDAADVGGHDLLAGLADMDYIKKQGINGVMYALIAFDSGSYEIPLVYEGGVQATRENFIRTILEAQLDDGGWSLAGNTSDIDMTAIAVQALSPYYDEDDQVKAAVDRGLALLSERQSDNGGYGSFGAANIESCAQVLTALTAMGIDPAKDSRFIKDGNTVIDAIMGYYVDGGGFEHIAGYGLDQLATEQGYYALTSYYRMIDGKTSLYDMSDVSANPDQPGGSGQTASGNPPKTADMLAWHSADFAAASLAALTALIAAIWLFKKRKEYNENK